MQGSLTIDLTHIVTNQDSLEQAYYIVLYNLTNFENSMNNQTVIIC